MGLLFVVAAIYGVWLWNDGKRRSGAKRKIAAMGAGLLGVLLLSHGQWAGALAVAVAVWLAFRGGGIPFISGAPIDEGEARRILGVGPGASESEVRDAHRRLILQVHPDRGGTAELARRVNRARDTLLGRYRQRENH